MEIFKNFFRKRYNFKASDELLHAAIFGDLESARVSIENGADVNYKGISGVSALWYASTKGYFEIATLLLDYGANTEIKDNLGCTPLYYAIMGGHRQIAHLLIKKGANVNAKDRKGWTPLHLAVERAYPEIVSLLLENGARVNARDQFGLTPLHMIPVEKLPSEMMTKNEFEKLERYFGSSAIRRLEEFLMTHFLPRVEGREKEYEEVVSILIKHGAPMKRVCQVENELRDERHSGNPRILVI